jgi:predicted dehydrogenase
MDLLYWLSGSEVESSLVSGSKLISAELDTAQVSFQMKSGLLANIHVSRVSSNMQRWIRATQKKSIVYANTGTLELEKVEPGSGETPVKVTAWTVTKADALQSETDSFVAAVKNNTPVVVSGVDGLKTLKFIEDIKTRIEAKL